VQSAFQAKARADADLIRERIGNARSGSASGIRARMASKYSLIASAETRAMVRSIFPRANRRGMAHGAPVCYRIWSAA